VGSSQNQCAGNREAFLGTNSSIVRQSLIMADGTQDAQLRTLVKEADPEVSEEWKWRGVPVWSHDGLICGDRAW
jgi:hypothetical protein